VKHLAASGKCEVDVFCVHSRDNALTRRLRHTPEVEVTDEVVIDDIRYNLMWYRFSIFDHLTVNKLHLRPFFFSWFMDRALRVLEGYDRIVAHSFTGGLLAKTAFKRYGVPYFVTWHGSDVHTHPWRNPLILRETRSVMEGAACNFFVSKALMTASDRITASAKKDVLYNGASEQFVRLPDAERTALRKKYGLQTEEKVVAFVGNLVAVKNVSTLYGIFSRVREQYDGPLKFWIIGDGKLRKNVESDFAAEVAFPVKFWGNVPSEEMPGIMNCIDILVLPSLNEGLPLVCAEALACGANVVGSNVGGIPEIIGKAYTIPHPDLEDTFAAWMATKVVALLQTPEHQPLPDYISWTATSQKEYDCLK
jgi:glycosyltransferase involved in cell wall biosynthesis